MSGGASNGPVFGGASSKTTPGQGLDPKTIEGAHFASDGSFDKVMLYTFNQLDATEYLINSGFRQWQLTIAVDGRQIVQKIWAQTKGDVMHYSNNMGIVVVAPSPWLPAKVDSIIVLPGEDGGSTNVYRSFVSAPSLEHLLKKEKEE